MFTYMENIRQHYAKSGWPHVKEVREMPGKKYVLIYIRTYVCNLYRCTMQQIYMRYVTYATYILNIFHMYDM